MDPSKPNSPPNGYVSKYGDLSKHFYFCALVQEKAIFLVICVESLVEAKCQPLLLWFFPCTPQKETLSLKNGKDRALSLKNSTMGTLSLSKRGPTHEPQSRGNAEVVTLRAADLETFLARGRRRGFVGAAWGTKGVRSRNALLPNFFGGGFPYNRLQKKVGTPIRTSLLEHLVS